ncbi:hypothetical protein F5X98DRAFT_336351 [Xylaria grammica]|nr:hypothetical protein F5X98DRAFT_336351 [Xylaria grammica]
MTSMGASLHGIVFAVIAVLCLAYSSRLRRKPSSWDFLEAGHIGLAPGLCLRNLPSPNSVALLGLPFWLLSMSYSRWKAPEKGIAPLSFGAVTFIKHLDRADRQTPRSRALPAC